jgi:hypothetical protein
MTLNEWDRSNTRHEPRVLPASYPFTVAQIFNLPSRRFVIGETLLAGQQVAG